MPKGTALEIPATTSSGQPYCMKYSRGGGGELFMLGTAINADDGPWVCLGGLRGMNEEERTQMATWCA